MDIDTHSSHEVVTLLSWQAPGRPFQKRSKMFFSTGLLLMLLIEIILFLFAQYMLMFVVITLVFVSFVFASIPPHDFHYRISTEGVTMEDHFYLWQELYDFYFKRKYGVDVLHIRTENIFPGELTLTLGELTPAHVKTVILPYLPYREYVKPTFMEQSADWLSNSFPLERDIHT